LDHWHALPFLRLDILFRDVLAPRRLFSLDLKTVLCWGPNRIMSFDWRYLAIIISSARERFARVAAIHFFDHLREMATTGATLTVVLSVRLRHFLLLLLL
jgi:hypothetical protein